MHYICGVFLRLSAFAGLQDTLRYLLHGLSHLIQESLQLIFPIPSPRDEKGIYFIRPPEGNAYTQTLRNTLLVPNNSLNTMASGWRLSRITHKS